MLYATKMEEGSKVEELISKIRYVSEELVVARIEIKDEDFLKYNWLFLPKVEILSTSDTCFTLI
jgi:hypothetical protein